MTVDDTFVIPTSAIARMSAICASRPCRTPALTTRRRSSLEKSSASISAMARPVAGREVRQEAFCHLGLPRFPVAAPRLQFFEPRERGVEVCLVEQLAAVDQVAFDRQEFDRPPLSVEALLRGPLRRMGDDRSEVAQPMHGLDVEVDVRREVDSTARMYAVRSPRLERCALAGGPMSTQSGVVEGSSCRLSAA